MTINRSHGKPRSERARLRDVGTAATGEERRRQNHASDGRFTRGNGAAVGRGAKSVLERPEAGMLDALAVGPGGAVAAAEAKELARDIRRLYRAARRELGSDSVLVLSALATWSREAVLAGHYLSCAAAAGVASEEGRAFVEVSQKCEVRAERASVQAQALAVKLAKPRDVVDAHATVLEAFGVKGGGR